MRLVKPLGLCSIILLLFLLFTNPQNLSPALLSVPFFLLFVIIFLGVRIGLSPYFADRQKLLRTGFCVAMVTVLLLALKSLGQLTIRDTVVVLALFGFGYLYINRFGLKQSN